MNRRLQQFISAENISQSQFADIIGVARASVSHIIAGRNKPGFDFVEKMARSFPALNVEWLITGKGKMYKNASGDVAQPIVNESPKIVDDLFGASWEESFPAAVVQEPAAVKTADDSPAAESKDGHFAKSDTLDVIAQKPARQRSITKIIVFYDDNSFQELR